MQITGIKKNRVIQKYMLHKYRNRITEIQKDKLQVNRNTSEQKFFNISTVCL